MSTIDKNERDGITSIAGSTTSNTTHSSLPEVRLQLVRKKTEQLERLKKLDLEQHRLQYEREKCALTDELELVELELQLSKSCNVSFLDIRDAGTTAYHTDPPHELLPPLLDPEIVTPRNPISFQLGYSIAHPHPFQCRVTYVISLRSLHRRYMQWITPIAVISITHTL